MSATWSRGATPTEPCCNRGLVSRMSGPCALATVWFIQQQETRTCPGNPRGAEYLSQDHVWLATADLPGSALHAHGRAGGLWHRLGGSSARATASDVLAAFSYACCLGVAGCALVLGTMPCARRDEGKREEARPGPVASGSLSPVPVASAGRCSPAGAEAGIVSLCLAAQERAGHGPEPTPPHRRGGRVAAVAGKVWVVRSRSRPVLPGRQPSELYCCGACSVFPEIVRAPCLLDGRVSPPVLQTPFCRYPPEALPESPVPNCPSAP